MLVLLFEQRVGFEQRKLRFCFVSIFVCRILVCRVFVCCIFIRLVGSIRKYRHA